MYISGGVHNARPACAIIYDGSSSFKFDYTKKLLTIKVN